MRSREVATAPHHSVIVGASIRAREMIAGFQPESTLVTVETAFCIVASLTKGDFRRPSLRREPGRLAGWHGVGPARSQFTGWEGRITPASLLTLNLSRSAGVNRPSQPANLSPVCGVLDE